MSFQIDTPPGITDIPDSLLAAGSLASGFVFSALKDNAAFGSVVPELFFGVYANGQTVSIPISPADGYQYEQSELLYCWEVYNTLPQGAASPSTTGALRACEWYVDQLTGTVHGMEHYAVGNLKQGGGQTTDGQVGVWTIGIRGRRFRTLATAPSYSDLPNSTFAQDEAATETNLRELSANAKLGSVQCEVFAVNPSNAPAWQPNTAYVAGALVQPTQSRSNGFWYIAANNGESGAQEPAWPSLFRNPAAIGDGGVLWNSAGCGFLNGQSIIYPKSEIDGYQYSAADSVIPHLAWISTESMPVQFHSGVIDSSAPYPAASFNKSVTFTQPALPTATSNRNFAPLVSALAGSGTVYTVLPANLQLGSGTYVAPPAMALASGLLTPGTTAEAAGVYGMVNCSVKYTSGLYSDGTVMVTLFCFRAIAPMDPNADSTPAGQNFTDFSTIAMTTGNPVTSPYMESINENAKFSILRPEVFFCTYVAPPAGTTQSGYFITSPDIIPGSQVPLPVSPTDGYVYQRDELSYLWWITASGGNINDLPGSQMALAIYVDPQSGVINSTDQTISPGSTTAGTNDASVVTVIFGPGGLLENNNNPGVQTPPFYQPTLNVIIFAQRQHETELQAQIVYQTSASAAQPSSNNLIPNGGFEIWSTPNPNFADITGVADDWFVSWQEGGTSTTDMGVMDALFQFPGQNGNPGSGPNAPYSALLGQFSQCMAVIPSAHNNNAASDGQSRKHTPLDNGSATLSMVSEIIPVWPGGEYALGFLAAAYATTDFSYGSSSGDPLGGVSPDWIGAGFYARVHLLGQQTNGSGQPDMGTDTVFELLGDQAAGGSLGLPAGLAAGTNNGFWIGGPVGSGLNVSPPMCEQFAFTFTIPAAAGVSALPLAGTLAPGNSLTPAANVASTFFNFSTESAFFSTSLPATGPETIDFVPYFMYVEFLLWDISGYGYDHLRVAVIDNVMLQDLTTGTSAMLQVSNLGTASAQTASNIASAIGSTPVGQAAVAAAVPATGITGAALPATLTHSSLIAVSNGLPVYANNAAAIAGGLVSGNIYRTGDQISVVH